MGIRESMDWCNDRANDATETLDDIREGARYHRNGDDVTSEVSSKAVATITAMAALIGAYVLLLAK